MSLTTIENPEGGADANKSTMQPPAISPNMEEAPAPTEETLPPSPDVTPTPTTPTDQKNVPWESVHNGVDQGVIASIDEMKDSCYFLFPDWKTRLTRFWMLLILAAIIATAGVIGNSTATVIGASE
jgi:hypothetical protein